MNPYQSFLIFLLLCFSSTAYCQQQDVDFHLNSKLLPGKTILKIKHDFYDPYLWVLAKNNEVYRVNTITQSIDNYSTQFASYSNLQFIDIAGKSKDTVFIATNSTNVLHFKNGTIKVIGAADGILGTVNSVGLQQVGVNQTQLNTGMVMIGTDKGFRLYDSNAETITYKTDTGNSKIYQATYRTEMYKDSSNLTSNFVTNDSIKYQPVVFTGEGSLFVEFLWEGGKEFGYNINTANTITNSMYGYNLVFTDLFWGNDRGLFQNYADYSYLSIYYPAIHYLNGIKVNKIADIYGLSEYGSGISNANPGLIKQTLLVGTDMGFYFSSSVYTGSHEGLVNLSLFHDDELGKTAINDISVNVAKATVPICEDGVWLACNDGLYFLKPDYAKYLNAQKLNVLTFRNQGITVTDSTFCLGESAVMKINPSLYNGSSIQWYKDVQEIPEAINDSLIAKSSGDYYAVLYSSCENIHIESNHLKVQVISSPVFSFNYPDKLQYCDSSSTTLKTDKSPLYHYRWYTNGVLNGDTTYKYTVTQSGKYKVEVSACTSSWVPSKEIVVDLINLPVAVISADKVKYCAGEQAVLTINTPVDPAYTINWYKDGGIINADKNQTSITVTADGSYIAIIQSNIAPCSQTSAAQQITFTPAPVFTFNYPDELRCCSGTPITLKAQGDLAYQYRWYKNNMLTGDTGTSLSITQPGKYKVEVSSCDGSWVPSKEAQVDIIDLPVPAISTDKPAYCIGDNATLSIAIPANPNYTINWYKDDVLLPAYTNQTSVATTDGGSYSVSIVSNQVNTDGSICTQTSSIQTIVFNPPPTVSIQKIVKTTLCDGQTVDLKVNYNTGTVNWSTGQTSDQISVKQSGTYNVTITSAAGCSTEVSADVQLFPNPILNIPNTAVCVPSHKSVTLTAPAGMSTYRWNGQQGNNTYLVDHPQTVTLTVTDVNGCLATQDIQVADECPDVRIPNAFTPNGDGINDTWNIVGLAYDQTATVKIFTRYGQQVYQSKGYGIPWNGEYQGKKLPAGAYYYIINMKNNSQTLSGEVTIVY